MILEVCYVFLFGFVIDISYVVWVRSVAKGRKILAGLSSLLITAPALFGYYSVFHNLWLSIPYLLGLFIGTVIGLFIHEKLEKE